MSISAISAVSSAITNQDNLLAVQQARLHERRTTLQRHLELETQILERRDMRLSLTHQQEMRMDQRELQQQRFRAQAQPAQGSGMQVEDDSDASAPANGLTDSELRPGSFQDLKLKEQEAENDPYDHPSATGTMLDETV